ncbi:MAG: TIGR04076 family protein [Succinivibrionaceae bacterium]|nr:TIGR04076 family protein [Succinivibrionaceae bacterium]
MQHRCDVTVAAISYNTKLQESYVRPDQYGPCRLYKMGEKFSFYRFRDRDDYRDMAPGKFCPDFWSCVGPYIQSALNGGAFKRSTYLDDRLMIATCNSGTRPVTFVLQRLDYLALFVEGLFDPEEVELLCESLKGVSYVTEVVPRIEANYFEVYVDLAKFTGIGELQAIFSLLPNLSIDHIE